MWEGLVKRGEDADVVMVVVEDDENKRGRWGRMSLRRVAIVFLVLLRVEQLEGGRVGGIRRVRQVEIVSA
jgi:hypothetical protein